jgi:hypothetical protein
MTSVEKDREVKSLRSAYRKGYRWAVAAISRGGYLIRILFSMSYYEAVRSQRALMAAKATVLVVTITYFVLLMVGTTCRKLAAKEILAIRGFLLLRFGLAISNRTVRSQAFLMGDFFPIGWNVKMRLCNAMKSYFLAVGKTDGRPSGTVQRSVTLDNIMVQLSRIKVSSEIMRHSGDCFFICGELDDASANLLGNGSPVVLYSGRLLSEGKVDMTSVVEIVDPFAIFNWEITVIARYTGKKGEITFYNEHLRRMPLGYRGALPGEVFWNKQPISIITKSGE